MAQHPNRRRVCLGILLGGVLYAASVPPYAKAALVIIAQQALPTETADDRAAVGEFSLDGAMPSNRLRATDLDAVRSVNDRAALIRALHDAEMLRRRREAGEFDPELRYRSPSNPYEAHRRIQEEYGPDSILTRSASTVAAIADGVERGGAKSFDGVATVTESLVNRGGDALGFDTIDVPRLKPRISGKRAGVYVSTDW